MKLIIQDSHPIIRREHAADYIFLVLISFAISVSFTRLFLNLTGFPKIGGGELHFAHVLWGGLILFIAALLPLVFANRVIFKVSAVGSGIGMGLFIDEVGKFITSTNDYFYPAAAPVIYGFFLLVVLIYLQTKKPVQKDTRAQLYEVFDDLKEVLDNDLSIDEKERLDSRLVEIISNSNHRDLTRLATMLRNFLSHPELFLAAEKPSLWETLNKQVESKVARWISPARLKVIMIVGLISWSMWSLAGPIVYVINRGNPDMILNSLMPFISQRSIRGIISLDLYLVLQGLQAGIGILILIFSIIITIRLSSSILNIMYFLFLISLTILTPLLFYFDQFSTIYNASVQFVLLLLLINLRELIQNPPAK